MPFMFGGVRFEWQLGRGIASSAPPNRSRRGRLLRRRRKIFHGMKIIADLSVGPHFALSASFGKGDGDRLTRLLHSSHPPGRPWQSPSFSCGESIVFMDIESDGEYLFHRCV
jgi:hypothetical protein